MLANISNQWSNYLFHKGEIGLLHNGLTISVVFIRGKRGACHFLVMLRSEPTTEILIFENDSSHWIPAFKIMISLGCGIRMHCV